MWVIGLTGTEDAFCAGLDLTPDEGQEEFIPLSGQDRYLDLLTNLSPITTRTTKRVLRTANRIEVEKQLHYGLWNIGKSLGSLDG